MADGRERCKVVLAVYLLDTQAVRALKDRWDSNERSWTFALTGQSDPAPVFCLITSWSRKTAERQPGARRGPRRSR